MIRSSKASILGITLVMACASSAALGKSKQSIGEMDAYYEGELLTVNVKEMPAKASKKLIRSNKNLTYVFTSNDLDTEAQEFVPVIDDVPGKKKFHPLKVQVIIEFNEGFEPHQFMSVEEIENAAAADDPEITLITTDEVYRCAPVNGR